MNKYFIISAMIVLFAGSAASGRDFDIVGWQLQDYDEEHIMEMVNLAAEYGVNHIQLSHDIVMNIDQLVIEHKRTALVRRVARKAKKKGMKTYVWTHEFNTNDITACIDPASEDGKEFWEKRQEKYREALKLAPEIDGIILSFGSSNPDPWALMCTCSWCVKHDNADRVALILNRIGKVVEGEYGKELYARTFIHTPQELEWVGEGLRRTKPRDGLFVMTKAVPQDWEPYYPHNSLIGNVGGHPQIVELDLAGEYWGKGAFPFDMTEYLKYRMLYAKKMGAAGFVVRIERGSESVFGSPNEINLYAFHSFVEDTTVDPDEVRHQWICEKYNVAEESEEAGVLARVYKYSFDVVRKMYYVLGFWALEKGSDLTLSATYPKLLTGRSIALYDPKFKPREEELIKPTPVTFSRIMEEKAEALATVLYMKTLMSDVKIEGNEELEKLRVDVVTLENAVSAWSLANGALWAYRVYESGENDEFRAKAAHFASALAGFATVIPEDQWPAGPERIKQFVSNFRMEVPDRIPMDEIVLEIPESPVRQIIVIALPYKASVQFFTDKEAVCWLRGGDHLMDLQPVTKFDKEPGIYHILDWEGMEPESLYFYTINCKDADGNVMPQTSDYWILTKSMVNVTPKKFTMPKIKNKKDEPFDYYNEMK